VFEQPVPVGPAAHYWMGGVTCDVLNRSSIPGLYVVGETASTGVHGANRLASNSLLECVVYGSQLKAIELINNISTVSNQLEVVTADSNPVSLVVNDADRSLVLELRELLPELMWNAAGIVRERAALELAVGQVNSWIDRFDGLVLSQTLMATGPILIDDQSLVREWGELRNLLTVGRLILRSALFREESRGGHFRADFPETRDEWAAHSAVVGDELLLI
jgi:L-aspartate oxidase